MKRIALFVLIFFFLNTLFMFTNDLYGQEQPQIQFNKIGEITGTDNHFLAWPVDVKVIDGQIFIADRKDLKIKVFSRDGAFIREMGGSGRGPGEFIGFNAIWKGREGRHIHVADHQNRKVVTFATNGSLVEEKLLRNTKIVWPRTIHSVPGTGQLVVYQPIEGDDYELFHLWDDDFNDHKYSFSLPADLQDGDTIKEVHRALGAGSSLMLDSTFYFAPLFYGGKIYSRNLNADGSWSAIKGVNPTGDTYESLNTNGRLENEDGEQIYDVRMYSPEGQFAFKLYNTTRALLVTQEGLIAHFVEIRQVDKKEHGIELYDRSGGFIGYQSYFEEELREDRYTIIPEYVKAIDDENRVYAINRKGNVPVISIYQLRVAQ